ncbi:DUF6471 domain-containing protein [Aliiroseovarius sp. PTFE2010]|uniref:DUF6471 domain-containing protein n=1 Tax=Aliiroseovarius sp. PTFE2010 TaxID=3417190 RepID=UPI003CEC08E9
MNPSRCRPRDAPGPWANCSKEPNLRNKLSRRMFSAAFLLQCLGGIGVYEFEL